MARKLPIKKLPLLDNPQLSGYTIYEDCLHTYIITLKSLSDFLSLEIMSGLTEELNTEINNRISGDTLLLTLITGETENRISGDTYLQINKFDITGGTIYGNIIVDGYIKGNSNSLTGLITDTVVYSISKTSGSAAFIDYVVWNPITLGYRSGSIMSVWDCVNNRIEFTETGTNDLFATTSDINFSCVINGTNVQLIADITGGTWNIKLGVRIL